MWSSASPLSGRRSVERTERVDLAAGDLGQWAPNVIDRNPSRQIRVDDFRASTVGIQAAFDRAKAAGAPCRSR